MLQDMSSEYVCVCVEPPIAGSVAIYAMTVHLFFMVPPWMLSSITCFFVEPVGSGILAWSDPDPHLE